MKKGRARGRETKSKLLGFQHYADCQAADCQADFVAFQNNQKPAWMMLSKASNVERKTLVQDRAENKQFA